MLLEDDKGFCPWCKQGTAFKEVHSIHYASPKYGGSYSFSEAFEGPFRTGLLIYECMHCEQTVVLLEHELNPIENQLTPFEGRPGRRLWRTMAAPKESPRTLHESAPENMRSLFAEASECEMVGAHRGAGVLYRAAVEELVKEQGANGKDLYSKIDSLKAKLPDELVEDLHEARMLGNDSIHAGITYSRDEVADVAKLIEEAVLVLYVQPEEKRAMREARKARRAGSR